MCWPNRVGKLNLCKTSACPIGPTPQHFSVLILKLKFLIFNFKMIEVKYHSSSTNQ